MNRNPNHTRNAFAKLNMSKEQKLARASERKTNISAWVAASLVQQIDELAKAKGVCRGQWINDVLEQHIKQETR